MKQKTYKKPSRGPNEPRHPWSVENFFRRGPDHDPPSVTQLPQEITLDGLSLLFATPKIRRLIDGSKPHRSQPLAPIMAANLRRRKVTQGAPTERCRFKWRKHRRVNIRLAPGGTLSPNWFADLDHASDLGGETGL